MPAYKQWRRVAEAIGTVTESGKEKRRLVGIWQPSAVADGLALPKSEPHIFLNDRRRR